jgi:hypothetical protein
MSLKVIIIPILIIKLVEWTEKMDDKNSQNPLDLTNYYSVVKQEVPIIRDSTFGINTEICH